MIYLNKNNKAFSIVELLVIIFLIGLIFTTGYRLFSNSYFFFKSSEDKLQNVHAVSVLMEGLRYELSSLPDVEQLNQDFLNSKGKPVNTFSYTKQPEDERGENKTIDITYTFDKNSKEIVKMYGSNKQSFGKGRITRFDVTHNFDKDKPVFPTFIRVKIETIDDNFSKVQVDYTIYPRLINKNLQLDLP